MTTRDKLITLAELYGYRHGRDPFAFWKRDVVRFAGRGKKISVYFSTVGYVVEAQTKGFRLTARDRGKAGRVAAFLATGR